MMCPLAVHVTDEMPNLYLSAHTILYLIAWLYNIWADILKKNLLRTW